MRHVQIHVTGGTPAIPSDAIQGAFGWSHVKRHLLVALSLNDACRAGI
jgi:hypothetical protein